MSELRTKMIEHMQLHRKAPAPQTRMSKPSIASPPTTNAPPINSPLKRFEAISTICSLSVNSRGVPATSWLLPSGFSMSIPWAGHPCNSICRPGLRVSNVVRLQSKDIESDPSRMLIRINPGKGNKDRYSLLSERLLGELRAYWKIACPRHWLVPASNANQPMASGTAQKIYTQARGRAGIDHGSGFHTLRHNPAYLLMPRSMAKHGGSLAG